MWDLLSIIDMHLGPAVIHLRFAAPRQEPRDDMGFNFVGPKKHRDDVVFNFVCEGGEKTPVIPA